MYHILFVEDQEDWQVIVKRALASSQIEITVAKCVKEALRILASPSSSKFDLAILDNGLPDGSGIEVLEAIRAGATPQMPVFILSGVSELDSKVTAFNLGADDYLLKPISGIELRARVEMRLKKASDTAATSTMLRKNKLTLDLSLMRASLTFEETSKTLPLTAKEFKILVLLAQNEGRVYSRRDLVDSVWGQSVNVLERTVDSHIFGLRKKLEEYSDSVECIPHMGYRFVSPKNTLEP